MSELTICLEAQSPLLLGDGMAVGNVQTSRGYIAGSSWRACPRSRSMVRVRRAIGASSEV